MANNYVDLITDALEQYGETKGYSHSRQFYEDMAWIGLQGTSTFNSLSSADRARILNIGAVELTGRDTNGSSKSQKGKNAGC